MSTARPLRHPLLSMTRSRLGRLTVWFLLGAVLGTIVMALFDQPIRGQAAPLGIVSFELAGTPERAAAILQQWEASDVLDVAWWGTWADFVYLVLYGTFFAALCAWVGDRAGEYRWRARAVWAATLAPLFDAAENVCLLVQVQTMTSETPVPELAAGFAAVKFTLLIACALYVLVATVAGGGQARRATP